mgnify:CR=1 FL=1
MASASVSLLGCGDEKNRGGLSVPRPLACLLVRLFLSAADDLTVSTDFIVALCGLSKTGLALVVRVELDGDSGLVLMGGGLLACLAVL